MKEHEARLTGNDLKDELLASGRMVNRITNAEINKLGLSRDTKNAIKNTLDDLCAELVIDAKLAKIIAEDFDGDIRSTEKLISLKNHGLTDFEFNLIVKKKQEVMDFLYTNFSEELL